MTESVRQLMQTDLRAAMAERDKPRVEVLRSALAAFANAEAVSVDDDHVASGLLGDVARRDLTDDHHTSILVKGCDDLAAASRELRELGLDDEASKLDHQASILRGYLPDGSAGRE
ncbi:MAG: GatB/YqeY domain-containing protein [Actinomycetota bacterium]|nr:GatB/YqeY domain-containing protein [Actinomycetota bacterium]